MLLNGKTDMLKKYSKGTYNKDLFIEEAKDRWFFNENQIRMLYLVADLAENANGVFSISKSSFKEMFEQRFNKSISEITVYRFFKKLEEIGILSINEAKRKNNQQSANIYIVEPLKTKNDMPSETPTEIPSDIPTDIGINKTINITINNTINKALNNNFVNKESVNNNQEIIDKLIFEFMNKGLSRKVCFMVLKEVETNPNVKNFGSYFRACLENTLYKHNLRHGKIDSSERFNNIRSDSTVPFYNWLVTDPDDKEIPY
jgi:hypothetical protein